MDSTTTSQTPAGAAMMGTITTVQLILIAIFALVTLVGIWWGMRLKRQRDAAARAFAANRDAAEEGIPGSTTLVPVAPSPSPLADEPIPAAAAFDATPASIAADVPEPQPAPEPAPVPAAAEGAASDLSQLKGLGPKLVATLAELGITRIDQIAALTPDQAEALDARLGNFRGRLARDRWIEQARLLTAGDRAAYEAEFGKLG
jgi:predicted flap endonuclease-1-like 5' DNA nuclease